MEEDGEELPPFWLQSSTTRRRTDRRSLSSLFLNSGVLILLLLVTAVVLMFFIIPSVQSITARVFRPNSVKKSWDSLNIILVLFAIVFGFLSRNKINDDTSLDEDQTVSNVRDQAQKSNPSTPHQWYEYSDRTVYNSASMGGGLRRASSSYPDLREVSPWVTRDDRRRWFDDNHVDGYRLSDSDHLYRRRRQRQVEEEDTDHIKKVDVDAQLVTPPKEVPYAPPPQSPPPPPPPQSPPPTVPMPAVKQKPRRKYHHQSSAHKQKTNTQVNNDLEPKKSPTPPVLTPPPPPPPPLPSSQYYSEQNVGESNRKRSGANATKDFLASLYDKRKKKKKQRQRSVDNFESLLQPQDPLHSQQPTPPPPPPPPPRPPPSVFQNLFSSKKGKNKRFLLVQQEPPSPPPPPPFMAVRSSRTTSQIAPGITTHKPSLPVEISSFNSIDENSNSGRNSSLIGNESPLIPIPPPPPPFKLPAWKFVVQGDYVRVQSDNSSRCGSPDLDEVESPPSKTSTESTAGMFAGDVTSPLFCPSPDVNTKADSFIARFRAGLKLEKNNSIKKMQGLGLSNLGPEGTQEPGPSQN